MCFSACNRCNAQCGQPPAVDNGCSCSVAGWHTQVTHSTLSSRWVQWILQHIDPVYCIIQVITVVVYKECGRQQAHVQTSHSPVTRCW
jgi:hypothetical protein